MQTKLTKRVNLRLEPGDLLRFFRVLEYVHNDTTITDLIAKSDAALLLDELREIRDIIKSSEAPRNLTVVMDVQADYERSSDSITLGDIIVPGERLPEIAEEVFETAAPLIDEELENVGHWHLDQLTKAREEQV